MAQGLMSQSRWLLWPSRGPATGPVTQQAPRVRAQEDPVEIGNLLWSVASKGQPCLLRCDLLRQLLSERAPGA